MRYLCFALVLGLAALWMPREGQAQTGTQYYLVENGAQAGPFTLDQLRARAAGNQLKAQDLIWANGMAGWTPVAQVPEVMAVLQANTPPDVPPPRDLNSFLAGTWIPDPAQMPVPGVGVGTVTGTLTFQAVGGYTLTGVIQGTGTGGLPYAIDVASTGTFQANSKGTASFEVVFQGQMTTTWRNLDPNIPSVPNRTPMANATYEILDDNTMRDGTGTIFRRKL